jgi:hypothetical protein
LWILLCFLIGKEALIEQDNFLTLTQGEFMTKKLSSDAYRAMSAQEKYNHINAIALGTSMEATGSSLSPLPLGER